MITEEEVRQRVSKALAALEAKRQAMTGAVTITAGDDGSDQMQAFAGTVLMTLAENGNTIHTEVFSRTYSMMIMMMKHFDSAFRLFNPEDMLWIHEGDVIYWSRARKSQLVALLACHIGSLAAVSDPDGLSIVITSCAEDLTQFCIMHGMNELELINDIPADISIKL